MTERDEQIVEIVATVDGEQDGATEERLQSAEDRLSDAEQRLSAAEDQAQAAAARIGALEAQVAALAKTAPAGEPEGTDVSASAGRKTVRAGAVSTLAKQGIAASALEGLSRGGRMEAGSLDTALASLSIEQRFAVKSEMLRAGLL